MENIEKSNTNQHGNSELKDEEIIKALPTVAYGGHSCNKCKYRRIDDENRCGLKGCFIARNALDLINNQKAELKEKDIEIDILIRKKDAAFDEVAELKAEVERLLQKMQQAYGIQIEVSEKLEKEIKSETIKEFEKLVTRRLNCNTPRGAYLLNIMNEVKKEMMESQ